jgi:hypothetical protein
VARPGMWLPGPGLAPDHTPSLLLYTLLPSVVRKCLLLGLMTCFADLTVIIEPKGEEGTGFSWKKWAQR